MPPNVTGVLLKRAFHPTLDIVLALHPDTARITVVAGTSEFDTTLLEQARNEFRAYEDRLAFTYLTDLALEDLLVQLSTLPPKTVVLYSSVFRDGAGASFVPHDVAARVSAAANAPVYGFVDQYLGSGIVGGHLYTLDTHGEQAAKLTLKVLAGAEPAALALAEPAAGQPQFDVRQLERWNLDERQLPARIGRALSGAHVMERVQHLCDWSSRAGHIAGTDDCCAARATVAAAASRGRAT